MNRQRVARAAACALLCLSASAAIASDAVNDLPFQTDAATPKPLLLAIQKFREGKTSDALNESRAFLKDHPDSPLGYEVLGAAAIAEHQMQEAQQALSEALRLDPKRALTLALLGQVAMEFNDPVQAEPRFSDALKLAPDLQLAHRGHALAAFHLGRVKEATDEAEAAVKQSNGDDVKSLYVLAGIYHETGRHEAAERVLDRALLLKPKFQEAALLLGLVELDLKKFDEASSLLSQVIHHDPGSLWARLGLSVVQRLNGHLDESRAQLEVLTKERPSWSLAHFQLGETRLAQGETAKALDDFSSAIRTSGNTVLTQLRVGGALLRYGAFEPAIAETREALKSPEVQGSARSLLVSAYLAQGKPELAEHELQHTLVENPTDRATVMKLGQFYLQQHRLQEALTQFGVAAALAPGDPEPVAAQAQISAALGHKDEAIRAAKMFAAAQGNSPEALFFLGAIYETLQQPQEAEQAYQQALTRAPSSAAVTRALALLEAKTNRVDHAVQQLEALASRYQDAATPLLDLARLYEQTGRKDQAIATYRRALKRKPYHTAALNNLAVLLGNDPKSSGEAFELAQQAYRLAPESPDVADTIGWLYYGRGVFDQAQALIARAVNLLPNNAEVRYHLGMVYLAQHNTPKARAELERALASPTFAEAEKARTALNSLR